jgi:hypothetical protein
MTTASMVQRVWNYCHLDNPPEPEVLTIEIVENIEAGLASFKETVEGLNDNEK